MERDLIPLGKEAYYIRVWLREMGGTYDHEHGRWLIPLSLREEAERRLRDVRKSLRKKKPEPQRPKKLTAEELDALVRAHFNVLRDAVMVSGIWLPEEEDKIRETGQRLASTGIDVSWIERALRFFRRKLLQRDGTPRVLQTLDRSHLH